MNHESMNPQENEPKPPFPKQEPPGIRSQMEPRPDSGEQSCNGRGGWKAKGQ